MQLSPLGRLLCIAHRRSSPCVSKSRWFSSKTSYLRAAATQQQAATNEGRASGNAQQPQVAKEAPGSISADLGHKFTREPLIKNLVIGHFDPEFLGFPELTRAKYRFLMETFIPPINDLLATETARNFDSGDDVTAGVREELKRLGLFGLTIPKAYGGLEMGAMETCRILEAIGENPGLFCRFLSHCGWVSQMLLRFGTEDQKKKYLPAMASGEKLGAWCFSEHHSGFDARCFETRAVPPEDESGKAFEDEYVLNGEKIPVVNGADADFFVIFAKTEGEDQLYNRIWETTAFIVDRNTPGVEVTPIKFSGMRGAGMAAVKLNDVRVKGDCIVGEKNIGYEHAIDILGDTHYLSGALCVAQMKKMVKEVVEFCVPRNSMLEPYYKHDLIRERIAKMATRTLLSESVLYGTCGMIDSGEYPEFALESAAAKIFCSEAAFDVSLEASRQLGIRSAIQAENSEQYMRNAFSIWLMGNSNDILRIFIALRCIEYAAKEMQMAVSVQRHPYEHPQVVFKQGARSLMELMPFVKPKYEKLKFFLHGHLHPSLKLHADTLEKFILRFPYCAEAALVDSGTSVGARQVVLRRLADVAVNLYAVSCGLGRASRSHCIGLKNSSLEMSVVTRAAEEMFETLEHDLNHLQERAMGSLQHRLCDSGKKILKSKDYCFEHALTHNWE